MNIKFINQMTNAHNAVKRARMSGLDCRDITISQDPDGTIRIFSGRPDSPVDWIITHPLDGEARQTGKACRVASFILNNLNN